MSNGLSFKGKWVELEFNPRLGKCSKCGFNGRTHLHHKQYDESNPLKNTIELCASCHRAEHYINKRIVSGFNIAKRQNINLICHKCNIAFNYRGFSNFHGICPNCKRKVILRESKLN